MGGAAQQGRANPISWACLGGPGPWAAEKPTCPQTSLGSAAGSKGEGRGRGVGGGGEGKLGVGYRERLCPPEHGGLE